MKRSKTRDYQKVPLNPLEAEIAIAALHATGEFTVVRKLILDKDHRFTHKPVKGSATGLCIDVETTGLDHADDKIIELGIVAFEFNPITAEIIRITDRYNGFEDPGRPLSKEITEITGITDEMVAGQAFDDERVKSLVDKATLTVAHNSKFDRPFVESRYPAFANLPWACTLSQLDWQMERISSRTLEYLLYKCGGYNINAHRALDDAEGVLGLLLGKFPVTGAPIFKTLLEKFMETTSRICAVNAPYDKKDVLKQRAYRWNDGANNSCKGWWVDVPQNREQVELDYLAKEIYPGGNTGSVVISRVDAFARYSVREG